jgi:hypothetical protein
MMKAQKKTLSYFAFYMKILISDQSWLWSEKSIYTNIKSHQRKRLIFKANLDQNSNFHIKN